MQKRILITAVASAIGVAVVAGIAIINFQISMQPGLPENDPYCETSILVQTTENIDRRLFSRTVLEDIERLDSRFMYDGRDISIDNLENNKLRITIDGNWSPNSSGARLIEALEKLESVESVLEEKGMKLITVCQ